MFSRRVRMCVCLAVAVSASQVSAESWSSWQTVSDRLIEARWKHTSFGRSMSGVCEFQFRATEEGTFNFRWDVTYVGDSNGSATAGNRTALKI